MSTLPNETVAMKAPIANKDRVLETLKRRLFLAESDTGYHTTRNIATLVAEDLREAIRFITEHAE